MNTRKYHQARRQKEQSRKARQQEKQDRRLQRPAAAQAADPGQPTPEGAAIATPTASEPGAVE